MSVNCVICREEVFLPVEMTCFRCYKTDKVCCSSFCRVCRKCAHQYLELDKSLGSRDFLKRCLYCPALINIMSLNDGNAYRKDYLLMSNDERGNHGCPYCGQFKGSQLEIDRHLDQDCPRIEILCPCGASMTKSDYPHHIMCCALHQECTICKHFVLQSDFERHQREYHNKIRCVLCACFIDYEKTIHHLREECVERSVQCSFCHEELSFRRLDAHWEEHERSLDRRLQLLTSEMRKLLCDVRACGRAKTQRYNNLTCLMFPESETDS